LRGLEHFHAIAVAVLRGIERLIGGGTGGGGTSGSGGNSGDSN
jgi:hypothetical protein